MRSVLVAAVILACAAGLAQGQTVFTVTMDGAQAATPSTYTGSGTVTLNQAQTQITVAVTHNMPNGNVTAGHIHQGAPGVNGGVIFGLSGNGTTPINEVISVSPAQVAVLQAGNYYINVHSGAYPSGEIRGQILPPLDTDQDLIDDAFETDTGIFVSATNTGTDPNDADSDDDGVIDGTEVQMSTDPNNALSFPSLPVSAAWLLTAIAGAAVVSVSAMAWRRKEIGRASCRERV